MRPIFVTTLITLLAATTVSASDQRKFIPYFAWPKEWRDTWNSDLTLKRPPTVNARNIPTPFFDDDGKQALWKPLGTCVCIRAPCPCDGSSRYPYYQSGMYRSSGKRSISSTDELENIKKALSQAGIFQNPQQFPSWVYRPPPYFRPFNPSQPGKRNVDVDVSEELDAVKKAFGIIKIRPPGWLTWPPKRFDDPTRGLPVWSRLPGQARKRSVDTDSLKEVEDKLACILAGKCFSDWTNPLTRWKPLRLEPLPKWKPVA